MSRRSKIEFWWRGSGKGRSTLEETTPKAPGKVLIAYRLSIVDYRRSEEASLVRSALSGQPCQVSLVSFRAILPLHFAAADLRN